MQAAVTQLVPAHLLRRNEHARERERADGLIFCDVWHETGRKARRVAEVSRGEQKTIVPSALQDLVLRKFTTTRSALKEAALLVALTEWATATREHVSALIRRLVAADILIAYQKLGRDQMTPEGPQRFYLGDLGTALLQGRLVGQDERYATTLRHWQTKFTALPRPDTLRALDVPQPRLVGYEAVYRWLEHTIAAFQTGQRVVLPVSDLGPTSHRHAAAQLAVSFLLGAAIQIGSGTCYDWKEIGARYQPGIGGSKRFDAQQERLLALLEDVSGIPPAMLGLTSMGSVHSVYCGGVLHYQVGTARCITPSDRVWSITSDEMEILQVTSVLGPATHVLVTENRALLLKMVRSGWAARHGLVLGLDGQFSPALARLLRLLQRPLIIWVDCDKSGLAIGTRLLQMGLPMAWVLPVVPGDSLSLTSSHAQWTAAMERQIATAGVEQEFWLGGPQDWDKLMEQAL